MNRSPAGPSAPPVRDEEGQARKQDHGRKRSRLLMPLRWVRGKLSSAVGWVRTKLKSLSTATIGKDRGFGSRWLVVTVAISLAVGLLVAVLVSPVVGILAALIVGIWMLFRRSRSPQSQKAASRRSSEPSAA